MGGENKRKWKVAIKTKELGVGEKASEQDGWGAGNGYRGYVVLVAVRFGPLGSVENGL